MTGFSINYKLRQKFNPNINNNQNYYNSQISKEIIIKLKRFY